MKRWMMIMVVGLVGAVAAQAGDWVDLFNGADLTGWARLNGTADYRVEDGAIVGTTVPGSPNSFLCSTRDYGDFELTFEVKVNDRLNSGVQIRSRVRGSEEGSGDGGAGRYFGPQLEIEASPGQAGYIYGEAMGTGWLSPEPDSGGPKASHEVFKNGEWNSYRVVAQGPRIQCFINGEPIADLTSEAAYRSHPRGSIGLQVHAIANDQGPYEVRWRNIRIKVSE